MLGPYRILSCLGKGGMGVVYKVHDPRAGRIAALKLLKKDADAAALARFEREATLMARIRHPNVVGVHQVGRLAEGPFILMDLVEGSALDPAQPRDLREVTRIVAEVSRAVEALHEAGVLHRDLKPDNVVLTPDGRPVLLDFGIARGESVERLTRTGDVLGTPAYMSPEQADGLSPDKLGPQVDVYGLGAMLFALVTGRAPYVGTPMQVIAGIVQGPPPLASTLRADTPPALDAICAQAMAPLPEDRYFDAGAIRADLDRFLAGERPVAMGYRPRRSWRGLAGVLGALLILVGLGAALLWRNTSATTHDDAPREPPAIRGLEVAWTQGQAEVRGSVSGVGDWIEVRLGGGEPTRVAPGEGFVLRGGVNPVATELLLEAVDSAGTHMKPRPLSTLDAWPRWFARLVPGERPPLPLPAGLRVSEEPREYTWKRDASVLVWVPPAKITLGRTGGNDQSIMGQAAQDEGGLRLRVHITRGVFLGKYELTWRQWKAYCAAEDRRLVTPTYKIHRKQRKHFRGSRRRNGLYTTLLGADHPAPLTYAEALSYMKWAGLRLPTAAEWELGARGTRGLNYPWGDKWAPGKANGHVGDDVLLTAPVGSFKEDTSPYGCMDMAGNLGEYTSSPFGPYPDDETTLHVDPQGPPTGSLIEARGGHWADGVTGRFMTFDRRAMEHGHNQAGRFGLRVALSPR
jgi:formylglycine-generating enzyme required for sulfatase activity/predicted Ser/Thr protein kinase